MFECFGGAVMTGFGWLAYAWREKEPTSAI
jgi:hypothetical protein